MAIGDAMESAGSEYDEMRLALIALAEAYDAQFDSLYGGNIEYNAYVARKSRALEEACKLGRKLRDGA